MRLRFYYRYFGSAARESHSTCDAHKSDCYNKPRWASNYRQESKVRQLFQLGCPHMRQLFQLGCPHLRQLFQLGCPHLCQLFQLGCSIRTNVIILVILELIPYFFQTSREGDLANVRNRTTTLVQQVCCCVLLLQAARCVPEGKTKVAPQRQGDPLQREGLPSVLGPSRGALPGQLGATRRAQLLRRRRVVLLHEGRAGMMVRLRPSLQPLHVASRWAAARALKRMARARRRELSLKFAQSLNNVCSICLFVCTIFALIVES